jgi:hypothetical protein
LLSSRLGWDAGEETARAYLRKAPGLLLNTRMFLEASMGGIVSLLGDAAAAKKVVYRTPDVLLVKPRFQVRLTCA